MKPTLYLIRGVPGSGKSTFARTLFSSGIASCIAEADQYFMHGNEYKFDPSKLSDAHSWCQRVVMRCLIDNTSVAVSNTTTSEKEVEVYKKIAYEHNANFVSLVVENRHNGTNTHNVPEGKVQQMKNRFSIKL